MKRNIFSILLLCLSCTWIGCNEDETPFGENGVLTVLSTEGIDFSAGGGEGIIVVDAGGDVVASSDKAWCKLAVDGRVVKVAVDESAEMSSRIAAVNIEADGKKVTVPVVQAGMILVADEYDLYHSLGYAGGSFEYSFKSNVAYTVSIPEEAKGWLSYEQDEEKHVLEFTVAPVSDKKPRGAVVKIVTSGKTIVLEVAQIEVGKEMIAGEWTCAYASMGLAGDDNQPVPVAQPVQIVEQPEEGTFAMPILTLGMNVPLTFEDGRLKIPFGVQVGSMQGLSLATLGSSENNMLLLEGSLVGVPLCRDGKIIYKFGRSRAEVGGAAVSDLIIGAFQGSQFQGWAEQCLNMELR